MSQHDPFNSYTQVSSHGLHDPLTSSFGDSLNMNDYTASQGKKRKREDSLEDLLNDSFVVRPFMPSTPIRPRTLQPLVLLPRSRLHLSSLDLTPTNPLAKTRLYESQVKILELEGRMGSEPVVLIARLDDGRTLYAVEREDRGLYVLCQLGSWVDLEKFRQSGIVSVQETKSARPSSRIGGADEPVLTPEMSKSNKRKKLAIEELQSLLKRPTSSSLIDSQIFDINARLDHQASANSENVEIDKFQEDTMQPKTASEIFDGIRKQYLETLYLSKTSLAYFAKGPLSRARAAFHLDSESILDMKELASFLGSLVLTAPVMEKKYREGVTNFISSIDIVDHSAEDAKQAAKAKRRKSTKKIKLGKNGLYPLEESHIRQWWIACDNEADMEGPGTTHDEIAKSRISQLRIRETQLQMIVILEVLALLPSVSSGSNAEGALLTASSPSAEVVTDEKGKPAKLPKIEQLSKLVDVHIDRLCIWQSITFEIDMPSGSTQDKAKLNTSTISNSSSDNALRDFCVDVIAPFFSARLPQLCSSINQKLGGPVAVSPSKPKLPKSASFSGAPPSRPGAATKRPIPIKPQQTLKQILDDDRERRNGSRGPSRPPGLLRSATAPSIPSLKREASETPSLSNIPYSETQPLQANRGGVLNSRRFAQREVDMSLLAPRAAAVKATRKKAIDSELKDAILALKKPNRELAGKSIAESAEKRTSLSSANTRKSKKPTRHPDFQSIQIAATPRANRKRDPPSLPSARVNIPASPLPMDDMATIPQSSLPRIPQSAIAPTRERLTHTPLFASIQATPTKKRGSHAPTSAGQGFLDVNDVGDVCIAASPLQIRAETQSHARKSSGQLFSSTASSSASKRPSPPSASSLQSFRPRSSEFSHVAATTTSTISASMQQTPVRKAAASHLPSMTKIPESPTSVGSTPDHGHVGFERSVTRLNDEEIPKPQAIDTIRNDTTREAQQYSKSATLNSSPPQPQRPPRRNDVDDIYKSLGWDDDDELL